MTRMSVGRERDLRITERTGYRFHDSLILASALIARCDTVWSEDMADGQRIEDTLTIVNPFRVSPP